MAQYICRYRKGEPLRWIGHLDLKRTLERALRRARLPLELTQGHNPHPKMSFGPPLPLGATGEAEIFSLHLTEALTAETLTERLRAELPAGLAIADVWTVPGYKKRETFGDINVADYRVVVATELSLAEVEARIRELLARGEIIVERGGERPERAVEVAHELGVPTIQLHVPHEETRTQQHAEQFLARFAQSMSRRPMRFSPEAKDALAAYPWPGNVRELQNAIERAVVVGKGDVVRAEDLPLRVIQAPATGPGPGSLAEAERAHVQSVLDASGWNITRAARILDVDRVTLYNKIKKYELRKPETGG